MKIAIVADIHGNYEAWRHFPESFNELWALGDPVNYVPDPAREIQDIRKQADVIIQDSHDRAVAYSDDSPGAPNMRSGRMADWNSGNTNIRLRKQ